jgi:peptidoglycan/LPS O-acetylase OafA/YrhL
MHGLDALRACAILSVMLFHISGLLPEFLQQIAKFGWMGVDLFFVLSGYLIGTQLLRPYTRGKAPNLRTFYRKRIYRILPAYLVVTTLYFTVPVWREATGISPLWQFLTFTENLLIDYRLHMAFSHAWSLCVEEHFYLALPLLVVWMMRKPALWKTAALVFGLVILGMGVRSFVLIHILRPIAGSDDFGFRYLETVYYPTYTHLDGLLVGVSLALVRLFRPAWWSSMERRGHSLLIAGLAMTGIAVWLFNSRFDSVTGAAAAGTVVGFPVLSLGLGLVVASSLSKNGLLARYSVPGAKLVATLAFSLYLTHKEIMHLDRMYLPRLVHANTCAALATYAVTCFSAAAILYLAVELQFLKLRDRGHADQEILPDEMTAEPSL